MARVQAGELKYLIIIKNARRSKDLNDHYVTVYDEFDARAGIMKGSGGDTLADGAARSVDKITFIVRWGVRNLIQRDAIIIYHGRRYAVDWMDAAPWAEQYARVRAVSLDEGER